MKVSLSALVLMYAKTVETETVTVLINLFQDLKNERMLKSSTRPYFHFLYTSLVWMYSE